MTTHYQLSGRRLAILADREKPGYRKILEECKRLKNYLADKNVEYWSGGTGISGEQMRMMIEDFNNAGLRPTICFPSLPDHAESARKADCLFRPYLANTSGVRGLLAKILVFWGRRKSESLRSKGGYPEGIEIRDTVYEILDGSTSVGKVTGARTIEDDIEATDLFEREFEKHPEAHGYLEGGSGTIKSPIYKRTDLIESVDSVLPEDRILHIGGSIKDISQVESMDDRIARRNLVFVVGNLFEEQPEKIGDFAALFPK